MFIVHVTSKFYWCFFLLLIALFPPTFPVLYCLPAPDRLENQLISLMNVLKLHSRTSSRPKILF